MAITVATAPVETHHNRLENVRPTMAKASLNKVENDWKLLLGKAIGRCFELAGLTDKEAAGLIDRDKAQVSRWIAGTERPQLDALFAVDRLRQPLVLALCELAGTGVEIETVVRIVRHVA